MDSKLIVTKFANIMPGSVIRYLGHWYAVNQHGECVPPFGDPIKYPLPSLKSFVAVEGDKAFSSIFLYGNLAKYIVPSLVA